MCLDWQQFRLESLFGTVGFERLWFIYGLLLASRKPTLGRRGQRAVLAAPECGFGTIT